MPLLDCDEKWSTHPYLTPLCPLCSTVGEIDMGVPPSLLTQSHYDNWPYPYIFPYLRLHLGRPAPPKSRLNGRRCTAHFPVRKDACTFFPIFPSPILTGERRKRKKEKGTYTPLISQGATRAATHFATLIFPRIFFYYSLRRGKKGNRESTFLGNGRMPVVLSPPLLSDRATRQKLFSPFFSFPKREANIYSRDCLGGKGREEGVGGSLF